MIVHNRIITKRSRIIISPSPQELTQIGPGFARVAGAEAFARAAVKIDSCQIRLKAPAEHAQCCLNQRLFLFHSALSCV